MKYLGVVLLCMTSLPLLSQEFQLKKLDVTTTASFRGLSVVDNNVAWLSGNNGTVGYTDNGGQSWKFKQVRGFETSDFRSIFAFDEQRAIIANAGSPAHILLTTNGGKDWNSVYVNADKDAFFDGIDFWNEKDGIIYGDPIKGKMLLLRTRDGGQSWEPVSETPQLEAGEASFAASGTGIRCLNKKEVLISTGGKRSRIWTSQDKGNTWTPVNVPVIQGESTTGIFSLARNNRTLIVVGGDFKNESLTKDHNLYSMDGGRQWLVPATTTRGYRECVESLSDNLVIAAGPSGIDLSNDNGRTWMTLSDEKGLHVVRKARKGSLVLLAGANGSVFMLKKL